jgi:hypothetical protein
MPVRSAVSPLMAVVLRTTRHARSVVATPVVAAPKAAIATSAIRPAPHVLNVTLGEGRFRKLHSTKEHRLVRLRYLGEVVIHATVVS